MCLAGSFRHRTGNNIPLYDTCIFIPHKAISPIGGLVSFLDLAAVQGTEIAEGNHTTDLQGYITWFKSNFIIAHLHQEEMLAIYGAEGEEEQG